jgi:hypothetical protein
VSQEGVKQGHGFGSPIYCVAKQKMYEDMAAVGAEGSEFCVRAFADNANVLGTTVDEMRKAFWVWHDGVIAMGGEPNIAKCRVLTNDEELKGAVELLGEELGISVVPLRGGIDLMGAPVGAAEFTEQRLGFHLRERHKRMMRQIERMDPQAGNLLLRHCALPRVGYIIRVLPHALLERRLHEFDEDVVATFLKIVGAEGGPSGHVSAPLSSGGAGIRRFRDVALAANLSSLTLSLDRLKLTSRPLASFSEGLSAGDFKDDAPHISVQEAEDLAVEAKENGNFIFGWICDAWARLRALGGVVLEAIPPDPRGILTGYYTRRAKQDDQFRIQRAISGCLMMQRGEMYREECSKFEDEAARNLSLSKSAGSAYLTTIPSSYSLILAPHEFRAQYKVQHSLNPLDEGMMCPCGKSKLHLSHFLSCKSLGASIILRHNMIMDVIARWLKANRYVVRKEVYVVPHASYRMDLVVSKDGIDHWLDVRITDPCNPTGLAAGSAERVGAAAKRGEDDKRRKWSRRAEEAGINNVVIVPAVLEATGRMATELVQFQKRCGRKCGPASSCLSRWPRATRALWRRRSVGRMLCLRRGLRKCQAEC